MGFSHLQMRRSALILGVLHFLVMQSGCGEPERKKVVQSPRAKQETPQAEPHDAVPRSEAETPPTKPKTKSSTDVAQPTQDSPAKPTESQDPVAEEPAAEAPHRKPIRPTDNWVIFRAAFENKDDALCGTAWLGQNQFEVKTENVKRVTIDLTRLPDGAPTKGPWIIRLDGQAVELTGFRPREGYTGLKRDLVRSQNGKWSVDKSKLYRTGSP